MIDMIVSDKNVFYIFRINTKYLCYCIIKFIFFKFQFNIIIAKNFFIMKKSILLN